MTFTQLKNAVAGLPDISVSRSIDPSEVVVRIKGSAHGEGYFTTCLEDALGTARLMQKVHSDAQPTC
jgi:hypothetical protein